MNRQVEYVLVEGHDLSFFPEDKALLAAVEEPDVKAEICSVYGRDGKLYQVVLKEGSFSLVELGPAETELRSLLRKYAALFESAESVDNLSFEETALPELLDACAVLTMRGSPRKSLWRWC